MSIETAIQNAQIRVEACYTQVSTQGGTIPTTKNLANLPQAISTISGGGIPNYIAPKNNVNGVYKNPNTATTFSLNGATDVDQFALAYAFYNCTNLTSVDFSSLTAISGSSSMQYCFQYCSNLTSVDLSSLTTISGNNAMASCFYNCTKLTELRFPALQSFGTSYTSQFDRMLFGVTGCTLHFPSNMQSEVERRTGYPNFGGTNTVVLFDLPATA